jgi:hypothetical protein
MSIRSLHRGSTQRIRGGRVGPRALVVGVGTTTATTGPGYVGDSF